MDELAATLKALEERLLQPAVRADRATLEVVLSQDFREFGSSGRVFDREAIVAALLAERQTDHVPRVTDFRCDRLASGVALVTYRLERDTGPMSLRSSIWVEHEGTWQMRFHQGTRVPV